MSTEQADPWIGTTVDGRYQIEDRVARGGMSTVYLARDHRLGRPVALKVLFTHLAEDRKVVERFEQEARNSALISHPNVVQVLDQGQTRETAYLVMEHVPGATLRTLLKRGPMTPRLAMTYAEAILQGLGAAHRAGLVHRDIKPENVLVSRDGRIKLADFGLARAATHHSGTSTLMGTVAYISPELLSGEGADERSDVYAVGILLYEMLTGVQPYTGDSPVRVAFQHVNSTVPAPSAAVPGLAQNLDKVVAAATAPDVHRRPKQADELLELITGCRAQLTDDELDFTARPETTDQDAEGAPQDAARTGGTAVLPSARSATAGGAAAGVPAAQGPTAPDPAAQDPAESQRGVPDGGDTPGHDAPQDSPAEEFPTRDEGRPWDDDVAAALLHARSGSSLDEAERQTVAEVPTEAFRAVDSSVDQPGGEAPTHAISWSAPAGRGSHAVHQETSEFSAVGPAQRSAMDQSAPVSASHPEVRRSRGSRPRWLPGREDSAGEDRRRRQRPTVELDHASSTRAWLTVAVIMIFSALLVLFAWYLGLSPDVIPSIGAQDGSTPRATQTFGSFVAALGFTRPV